MMLDFFLVPLFLCVYICFFGGCGEQVLFIVLLCFFFDLFSTSFYISTNYRYLIFKNDECFKYCLIVQCSIVSSCLLV